jgi:hypothetical protein
MRRAFLGLLLSSALLASGTALGGERTVVLGEVSTVARPNLDVIALRATLETELAQLKLPAKHETMVLSVSVVKLDTEASADGTSTACIISATLRAKKSGNMVALLEGRAHATDRSTNVRTLEEGTLHAAVHGAVVGIPDALR